MAAASPPPPLPATTLFPPKGVVREIKVHATKRVKVRILHDSPNAASDYYGYMNPAMGSRSFRGKYFWIKTADPSALQITIDGQPASGPEAGVEMVPSAGL